MKKSMKPVVKRKKSIIVISWLAPLVALIISFGMLQEYFEKKGNIITIYVNDVKGLNIRKSHIEFRGVKIGNLVSIKPDENNINRFVVKAQMYNEFNYLVKKGSQFWIVSNEISTEKIENIGTILTGDYIETLPPVLDVNKLKRFESQKEFVALEQKPNQDGKIIELNTKKGSVAQGAKIQYKGITVGSVIDKKLSDNGSIDYKLLIYKKYQDLVKESTYFYQQKPLNLKLSMTKLDLEVAPIKHFLNGSISFLDDETIKEKNKNYLYEEKDELYYDDAYVLLKLKANKNFTYIKHNDEVVAKIIDSNYDIKSNLKIFKVKFKLKYKYILQSDPEFLVVKNEWDIKNINLKKIIQGDQLIVRNNIYKRTKLKSNYNIKIIDPIGDKIGLELDIVGDNIAVDEKIFYKNIEVGFVKDIYLENAIKKAKVVIYKKYTDLIDDQSKFYRLKDLDTKVSMDGIEFSVGSFKQIFYGGISFIVSKNRGIFTKKEYKLYDSFDSIKEFETKDDYFYISLEMDDSYDLRKTSKLYYKNHPIGEVVAITLDDNIQVKIKVENKYKKMFGIGSKIYLQGMKFTMEKIQNISSAVLGDKLYLVPTYNNIFKNSFQLDSINPIDTKYKNGLRVKVIYNNSKNISVGTPLYYKFVEIGKIESVVLNHRTNKIEFLVFIADEYKQYIKNNSTFYKTKLIDVDLGLFGSKVDIGTLKSLIKGGISVTSPKEFEFEAKNFDQFELQEEFEEKREIDLEKVGF
jgi:paraquat-inducible protein B